MAFKRSREGVSDELTEYEALVREVVAGERRQQGSLKLRNDVSGEHRGHEAGETTGGPALLHKLMSIPAR